MEQLQVVYHVAVHIHIKVDLIVFLLVQMELILINTILVNHVQKDVQFVLDWDQVNVHHVQVDIYSMEHLVSLLNFVLKVVVLQWISLFFM